MFKFFTTLLIGVSCSTFAQHEYIKKCEGNWKGMMHMYKHGTLRDSVAITLTIEPIAGKESWTWRTQYHSASRPMTKDYTLRVKDAAKRIYITDEGGGVELTTYQQASKLYNVFETSGVVLTSTYECLNDRIIFEVTSGKKEVSSHPEIINYSVDNLQRAVLFR